MSSPNVPLDEEIEANPTCIRVYWWIAHLLGVGCVIWVCRGLSQRSIIHIVFDVILTVLCAYLYHALSFGDPGFVPLPSPGMAEDGGASTKAHLREHKEDPMWCLKCGIERPIRSKHCKHCKRCVMRYDHHCGWLGRCVGQYNHRRFWFLLISETSLCVFTFGMCVVGIVGGVQSSAAWLASNLYPVAMLPFLLVNGFFALSLCVMHTGVIATNTTSWEWLRRSKIPWFQHVPPEVAAPWSLGLCRNLRIFFWGDPRRLRYEAPTADQMKGKRASCCDECVSSCVAG
ncbi:putative protein S-acyltransferase 10 [Paratrimastix pyriformis]|uniref:Palmitoyltransferase n=1 Tax=Paratrimastix pyriformis TaxID=342808 RepID=A0ABQ8ULB3_9EUKA|nr:putative protein S-acyltransferase 10 [Paratrimastix pyriformis]